MRHALHPTLCQPAASPARSSTVPSPSADQVYKAGKLKGEETAVIDQVAIVGGGPKDKGGIKQANIKLRFNRNPVIGKALVQGRSLGGRRSADG